jgi:arylsulfatase A-like enzyme
MFSFFAPGHQKVWWLLLLFLITGISAFGQMEKKPNVLFILADDLGYNDLGCMGSKFHETPHIDRLASEGMVFTHGYAAAPNCSPSRASILNGKFTVRHGITDFIGAPSHTDLGNLKRSNILLQASIVNNLPHEDIILPEALKEAGYQTFLAGKWHLGSKGSWASDHGFDVTVQGGDPGTRGGYFSPFERSNLEDVKDGEEHSMRMVKETIQFMKKANANHTGKPFFAFLSFDAVHGPVQTTKGKWAKYRQKAEDMGIAPIGFKMGPFLPIRQVQDNPVYAGLVEAMDDAVGVLLGALEELGLDKNTVVIFTSDNGGVTTGEFYSTSNLPLRAGKGYLFEGGIRVPYFIKVPWIKTAGQTCDTPVNGTDFYPTVLELAGVNLKPKEHTDGISLLPLLKSGKVEERPLIWHFPHYSVGGEPSSVIRKGDWKLIHFHEDGREELYDLRNDPGETKDISKDKEDLVKQMSTELFVFLKEVKAKFPEKNPDYNKELKNKYLKKANNEQLPWLEEQRLKYLSKDFDPGNNWWGSNLTNN